MTIDWTIEAHDTVKSTQDIVKGMGDMGHPEGMVVQAAVQEEGYGRHGRSWVSEKGNLFISILLRPSCHVQEIGQLSIMASLAVAGAVKQYLTDPSLVKLKWPNDVLIDGQKCAGLILETGLGENHALKWVAVGIGVNINSAPEDATSISGHAEKAPSLGALQNRLLKEMNSAYTKWNQTGMEDIRKEWLEMGHEKNELLNIKVGEEAVEGYFHDIDEHGNLLIRDEEYRLKKITSGEVYV